LFKLYTVPFVVITFPFNDNPEISLVIPPPDFHFTLSVPDVFTRLFAFTPEIKYDSNSVQQIANNTVVHHLQVNGSTRIDGNITATTNIITNS